MKGFKVYLVSLYKETSLSISVTEQDYYMLENFKGDMSTYAGN